jgi:hypothetical protein
MKSKSFLGSLGKHLVGLAVVAAVVIGAIIASVSIHDFTRADATTQIASVQAVNDGTTHDMTIVWPDGKAENLSYSETITPKHSEYTGPKNYHKVDIRMVSFNPLDSANKAGEGMTPSTFAEGDRPAIVVNEDGVNASKASGAKSVGEGGAKPSLGEFMGWGVIGILGLIALFVMAGVFKWLWAEWQKVEPAVVGIAENALHIPTTPVPPTPAAPVAPSATVASETGAKV